MKRAPENSKDRLTASLVVNGPSTVLIIEKRPLIRDLLSNGITCATELGVTAVGSIDDYMEPAHDNDVKVVLVSVAGDPESQENQHVIRNVVTKMGGVPIVVMSDSDDLHKVVSVLHNGTQGYVSTGMPFDLALSAIRLVQAGGQFLPASSVLGLPPLIGSVPVAENGPGLLEIFTVRQAAVVKALRQGKANKTIAYELNMRESTVKVHVRNIMKKLKATNRTEVVYIANQLVSWNSWTAAE